MNLLSMFDIPENISTKYYDSIDLFSRESIWQLCYRDLRNSKVQIADPSELSELCYNTATVFPDNLQEMATQVLNNGKSNLLNAKTLFGKGIKVAVIDRPINQNHIEFKNRLEYIEVLPEHEASSIFDFHGMVCASFLCGSTCGVASEAELVYFAIPNKMDPIEEYYGYQLTALQKVLEYNKSNKNPIRIVSLSAPFAKEQLPQREELVCELAKTNCTVIDATMHGKYFQGIDFERYQEKPRCILNRWQYENFERNKERRGFVDYFNDLCFVPSSRRTSAGNESDTEYIHWSKAASESWTIPHVAGAYALCLQVQPNLSFLEFLKYSKLCARQNEHIILDVDSIVNNMCKDRESS
ncbi:MAG TPA: hypothetical protein DDZ89_14715 [Clostridiales bacterium]|nr:hypothetical protein [Clostridiales bacterium]